MSGNPVDVCGFSPPRSTVSRGDPDSFMSSFKGGVVGIVSLGAAQSRPLRVQSSFSDTSLVQAQSESYIQQKDEPAEKDDAVMQQLRFRYATKPSEQMYEKTPQSARSPSATGGRPPQSGAERSTMAVQQETVGMLCRTLPRIAEASGPVEAKLGSIAAGGKKSKQINLDDRITPQTLFTLLHKGRALASRVMARKNMSLVEDDGRSSPNDKLDGLRTQVARIEPPYVDQMLKARVFHQAYNDEDTTPRESFPIASLMHSSKRRKNWRSTSSHEYHSHLIAPPPTRMKKKRLEDEIPALLSGSSKEGGDQESPERVGALSTVSLTRSTSVGDDASIIDQVLAYAAARRRPDVGCNIPSEKKVGIPNTHPSYTPLFSALDVVLSVSKEYEKIQQTWPGANAMQLSASRNSIIDRISSWKSTLVPRSLWVSISNPTFSGTREQGMHEHTFTTSLRNKNAIIFPAVNPTGRAQVYLLADALDRMLQEIPDTLSTLADRNIAKLLIPEAPREEHVSFIRSDADVDRIINPSAIKKSDYAHRKYVEAVNKVMEIIDVGLVEIVRQISHVCVERGALLDSFRLLFKDINSSCVWIIGYCKDQARREAKARKELIEASRKDVEEVILLRDEVRKRRQEELMLRRANGDLEHKASKYDTLIERLQLKDKKFSRHPVDQHLRLLMELEENFTQLTRKGLEELYERQNTESDDTSKINDAPTTQMNNHKQEEQEHAQEELYTESYRLLAALTEALNVVDVTCEPLYDRLSLPQPTAASKMAAMKWAEIARSVGSYELEKKHRQKVFDVFAEWNGMQGKSAEMPVKKKDEEEEEEEEDGGDSNENKEYYSPVEPPLPLVQSLDSTLKDLTHSGNHVNRNKDNNNSAGDNSKKHLRFITWKDLSEMGVTDCTPEEINALYNPVFDLGAFLQFEYTPPQKYEMTPKLLCEMVHDVTEALRHITIRVDALANSGLLRESVKLPMKPPAYPEDPCVLCGRRDYVAMEKRNKSEAMQRVANEIQRRYDEVVRKCQKAESERENLRKEIQRCQLREKKQMEEWFMRENELKQANAALLEENRRLAQRAFSATTSMVGNNSSSENAVMLGSTPWTGGVSVNSEDFISEDGDDEDEKTLT